MKIKNPLMDPPGAPAATRLMQRPAGGSNPEDRLASLLRRAEPSRGLEPLARARVLQRLAAVSPPRHIPAPLLRWGLVALVLLSSGAVVASVSLGRWWQPMPEATPATPKVRPVSKAPRSTRREAPLPPAPAPVVAAEEVPVATAPPPPAVAVAAPPPPAVAAPEPMPRPEAKRRLARNSVMPPTRGAATALPTIEPPPPALVERPVTQSTGRVEPRVALPPRALIEPPPARAALPMPSPLLAEAQLIKRALVRLRRDADAEGALAELDVYLARFPQGTLQHEARIARADALLSLKRDGEALQALEAVSLGPQGRDQELRVIRGELRSLTACGPAIADFTQVLAGAPPGPLAERALYGRAACRLRQGDSAGAVRDLGAYLRRFPLGRFAADARAAKEAAEK